jgi:hypothetical protein
MLWRAYLDPCIAALRATCTSAGDLYLLVARTWDQVINILFKFSFSTRALRASLVPGLTRLSGAGCWCSQGVHLLGMC